MNEDEEDALEARRRTLGAAEPRCSVPGCPQADPRALSGAYPNILCAEHRAILDGRRTVEEHHVAGRNNSPATVGLLANTHAIVTFMQGTGWRPELLRNPTADPLLRLEAAVRGSRETVVAVLEDVVLPTEREIRDLHAYLVATQGPDWAAAFRAWLTDRPDAP